jgi:hypothetical protein
MSNQFPDWADTISKQLLVAQAKGLNITQDAPEMLGSFDLCTRWVESREVWLRSLASASARAGACSYFYSSCNILVQVL